MDRDLGMGRSVSEASFVIVCFGFTNSKEMFYQPHMPNSEYQEQVS